MDANEILTEVDKVFSEASESFDAELPLPVTSSAWDTELKQMTVKQKAAQELTTTNDH